MTRGRLQSKIFTMFNGGRGRIIGLLIDQQVTAKKEAIRALRL